MSYVDPDEEVRIAIQLANQGLGISPVTGVVEPLPPLAPSPPATQVSPGTTPATDNQDAFARLRTRLAQYDLTGLADWAWGRLQAGISETRVISEIREQPLYKQRFPYVEAMRQAGLPFQDEAVMLRRETEYKQLQRRYGIEPSKNPADYTRLFTGDVSANEFGSRLNMYYKLRNVYSPYIRQQMLQQAGINVGDSEIYNMFSGQDTAAARRYAEVTNTQFHTPSFADLERAEELALDRNRAEFSGGGGVEFGENAEETVRRRKLAI